jgi:periplasmic divalent cation tolerance protein
VTLKVNGFSCKLTVSGIKKGGITSSYAATNHHFKEESESCEAYPGQASETGSHRASSMNSEAQFQLVLTTCPDKESGSGIARALVESGAAACVNLLPGVESVYKWQGKVETARELLLIIKAPTRNFAAIEALIRKQHPYELPEIVAVPIARGLDAYLRWLDDPDSTIGTE